MAEYIEREEAMHIAFKSPFFSDALMEEMKAIPAADVAPVRHGHWITTSGEVFPGSSQFLCYSHKHEECGFQYVDMNENEYDYCPNCGARMDREDGE